MKRDRLTIDLGGLGALLKQRCHEEDQTPTTFVLRALEGALGAKVVKPVGRRVRDNGDRVTLRASVSRETFELIQQAQQTTGARSLADFLEGMAAQATHVIPRTKGVAPELMEAFSRANYEMRAVGRNVNQIAHSLNIYPGKITDQERRTLAALPQIISDHVVFVSKTLLALQLPRRARQGKGK